jgi:glycosyltransferase involved in cell wall biosynthesis
MRIGLIVYGSLETRSGGYLYDRTLVAHLRACGDEVELVSLPWRHYGAHLLDNASPAWRARLRRGRWQVVLQDELNHPSLFAVNELIDAPIISIVHHLRSSEQHPRVWRPVHHWVEARYLAGVDGFVFNSNTTRGAVAALRPALPRHVIAPPAGDRLGALVAPPVREPGPLRLLFVGNVIARKGLATLLEALARLRGVWALTVAGSLQVDPRHVRTLQARAARLGIGARIDWRGSVGDERLRALFTAHHALVVPSSYEGFGIVYLEAHAFALPALGTTAGGAGEIIVDGETGWLVPAGDVAALAERLQRWHDDRAVLARQSAAALERFRQFPGWEQTVVSIREFLAHG